jgi:hypothetical protein
LHFSNEFGATILVNVKKFHHFKLMFCSLAVAIQKFYDGIKYDSAKAELGRNGGSLKMLYNKPVNHLNITQQKQESD